MRCSNGNFSRFDAERCRTNPIRRVNRLPKNWWPLKKSWSTDAATDEYNPGVTIENHQFCRGKSIRVVCLAVLIALLAMACNLISDPPVNPQGTLLPIGAGILDDHRSPAPGAVNLVESLAMQSFAGFSAADGDGR